MKSLSISRRLWLPTLAVVAAILFAAVVIGLRTQAQVAEVRSAQLRQQQMIVDATQWAGLTEANAARALAVLQSADPALGVKLKPEMDATTARISEIQKGIEALAEQQDEKAALERVAQTRKAYVDLRREVLSQRGDATEVPAEQVQAVRGRLTAYLEAQRSFVSLQHQRAEQQAQATASQRMATVYGVVAVMLALAGVMVLTTRLTTRAIVSPLVALAAPSTASPVAI